MSNNDDICIARIFKGTNGKQGHGSRCTARKKIGEFCGKHGKRSTRVVPCKEKSCKWFGKMHAFGWEHCGRYDELPPAFFKDLTCYKLKESKDNKNIYTNTKTNNMLNFGLNTYYKENKITISQIEEMVLNKVDRQLTANIKLMDDLTKENQLVIIDDFDNEDKSNLLNELGQVIGHVVKWEDETIPDKYKSNDGFVLDPETNEPLYEFIVNDNELSTIPVRTYREYNYDENFDHLRPSYEVEYI